MSVRTTIHTNTGEIVHQGSTYSTHSPKRTVASDANYSTMSTVNPNKPPSGVSHSNKFCNYFWSGGSTTVLPTSRIVNAVILAWQALKSFLCLMPIRITEFVLETYCCLPSLFNAQLLAFDSSQFCFSVFAPPSLDPNQKIISLKFLSFLENRSDDDPNQDERNINLSSLSCGNIPLGTIAIDCAASISIFGNLMLLQHIQKIFRSILVHCGATKFYNMHMGNFHSSLWHLHLPLPKTGYYTYPNGVANLLSLTHVSKEYRVYYNSWID